MEVRAGGKPPQPASDPTHTGVSSRPSHPPPSPSKNTVLEGIDKPHHHTPSPKGRDAATPTTSDPSSPGSKSGSSPTKHRLVSTTVTVKTNRRDSAFDHNNTRGSILRADTGSSSGLTEGRDSPSAASDSAATLAMVGELVQLVKTKDAEISHLRSQLSDLQLQVSALSKNILSGNSHHQHQVDAMGVLPGRAPFSRPIMSPYVITEPLPADHHHLGGVSPVFMQEADRQSMGSPSKGSQVDGRIEMGGYRGSSSRIDRSHVQSPRRSRPSGTSGGTGTQSAHRTSSPISTLRRGNNSGGSRSTALVVGSGGAPDRQQVCELLEDEEARAAKIALGVEGARRRSLLQKSQGERKEPEYLLDSGSFRSHNSNSQPFNQARSRVMETEPVLLGKLVESNPELTPRRQVELYGALAKVPTPGPATYSPLYNRRATPTKAKGAWK